MMLLRRLEAIIRALLSKPHPQPGPLVQPLVGHVHRPDICRDYGQYNYKICLNGCNTRWPC